MFRSTDRRRAPRRPSRVTLLLVLLLPALVLSAGCRQDMHDQPRYEPLEENAFFDDGRASRPKIDGTVARGQLRLDPHLYEGRAADGSGAWVTSFPFEVDAAGLDRGQQRYDIFCSVCHDRTGSGNGMVVQRGFKRPPSMHEQRLRDAQVGYIFDVITNGYGAMPDYRSQIPARDRWLIAAYLRALQLSQNATPEDVPADQRSLLVSGSED